MMAPYRSTRVGSLCLALLYVLAFTPSVMGQGAGSKVAISPEATEDLPAPVSVRAELLHPDGRAVSDSDPLKLGDLATFRVVVEAPPDARIYVPTNPAIAPLRLSGTPLPPQRKIADERLVEGGTVPLLRAVRVALGNNRGGGHGGR